MNKNLALCKPSTSFPQGSDGGFLVPLTKGKFAIVDEDMFDYLNQWKWQYHSGYARRSVRIGEKIKQLHMSHVVLPVKEGMVVDHINRNPLDNRKNNLRVCSQKENILNSSRRKDNASGYTGVSFYGNKWRAYIQSDKKWKHIGYFKDGVQAAIAYNKVARELFGEFARLNAV